MIAEAQAPPTPVVHATSGPYKFLDYFHDADEDQRRFGGREREIREIVARIASERTLVVYGPSGIGKTSLLLAGVFPALRKEGYRPIYARTLADPLADLRRALAAACDCTETGLGGNLRPLVAELVEAGPVVVVLDQFEEFFTRFNPEKRTAFIEAVAGLIKDPALDSLKLVFSLREDFLASLDEFGRKLREPLSDRRYRIEPLTAFGVRQAVAKPLVDAHIDYEPAVVSKLVSQLESVGFEPPLLQILCTELYQEALRRANGESPRIELKDLDQLGGPEGIFRRYVNSVGGALPPERHLLARMVLDALITREGTKRAATLGDLLTSRFTASEEEIREVLELFVNQRLLRRQIRESETWYEVIHERLVPSIQEWLESDSEFVEFRQARSFIRSNSESDLWRRNPETLLNKEIFAKLLRPHQERFRFNEHELEFVLCSAMYHPIPDAAFWAHRLGSESAVDLVEKLAASASEEMRKGALLAAGSIDDIEGRLARICLRLALEDPGEPVRRAAGRSLARLARDEELHALSLALSDPSMRRQARGVLASMALGGHSLRGFPWTVRRLSKRRGRRIAYRESRDIIRSRQTAGAVSGALGSVAWLATLYPFLMLALLRGTAKDEEHLTMLLGWTVITPILGAILGWLASGTAAKRAAVVGEGRWFSALLRSMGLWGFWIGFPALLGVAGSVEEWRGSFFKFMTFVAIGILLGIVVAIPMQLTLALLAWLSRPCLRLASRSSTWIWGLLVSFGIPLWPALANFRMESEYLAAVAVMSLLLSCASCVSILAIARSSGLYPLGDQPAIPSTPNRRRRILVALAATITFVIAGLQLRAQLSRTLKAVPSVPIPHDQPTALPSGEKSGPAR